MEFLKYNQKPGGIIKAKNNTEILSFITGTKNNIDAKTVEAFGEEWSKFSSFSEEEITRTGIQYFDIIDDKILNKNSIVLDAGCGSGRWTKYIAGKVNFVEATDPSKAVYAAAELNKKESNVRITQAEISNIPFDDNSFDLIICLGVLHHIPDTKKALQDVVKKLKPGGKILLYLYYNLDNRGTLYKFIFHCSSLLRRMISKMPAHIKKFSCDIIAIIIYLPLIYFSRMLLFIFGMKKWIKKIPLSYYTDKSFNIIRNDSLDRFGTPLEQRFSKKEIEIMMLQSGLIEIVFSSQEPYWHAVGKKV
jgi:SAM-dependent methyltransferase